MDHLEFVGEQLLGGDAGRGRDGLGGRADRGTVGEIQRCPMPQDDEVLAKVRSVWVLLDAKTLRPKRVSEELRSRFENDRPAP